MIWLRLLQILFTLAAIWYLFMYSFGVLCWYLVNYTAFVRILVKNTVFP
jgi:hypothetical protein